MDVFPEINEFQILLDEISNKLPKEIYKDLNKGIVLYEDKKMHKDSRRENPLYILGEYGVDRIGRHIGIYYGSFKNVYGHLSRDKLLGEIESTLKHEFIHHLESMAGEKDLEIEDSINLLDYNKGMG